MLTQITGIQMCEVVAPLEKTKSVKKKNQQKKLLNHVGWLVFHTKRFFSIHV